MARYIRVEGELIPIESGPFEPVEEALDVLYARLDGAEDFTEPIGGVDPIEPEHLATKAYVDQAIANALE